MLFKTYIYYFYFNKEEIIKYIIEKKYKEVINLKLDKDFYKLLFNKNFYVFQYICCYYPNEIYYYLNKLIENKNNLKWPFNKQIKSGIYALIKSNKPNLSLIKDFIDLLDNPTEDDYYNIYLNLLEILHIDKSLSEYIFDKIIS